MSDKYTVGRTQQVLVPNPDHCAPVGIDGHPVVAAFLRMDNEGWIVVFHEDTTPAAPYGYEDPDGFVVASVTRAGRSSVKLHVLACDEAYDPAIRRAGEAAYMNEG